MRTAYVYVTDERGLELATHSAISLAMSQVERCDIHLFCFGFSPDAALLSAALREVGSSLTAHPISDPAVERHQTCGHVTTPSLLKIAAVETLMGRYDRLVYLDCDTLVFGDLQIETLVFGTAPIAAVIDMDLSDTGALRHSGWVDATGGCEGVGSYFNVGVLIFESRNWRRGDYHRHYAAELVRHDVGCSYKLRCTSIEQCALNRVFEANWLRLPATYNMQASAKFTPAWQTALVRHYCGTQKFLPVRPLRNDARDVRVLNAIGREFGRPPMAWPMIYDGLFRLNGLRNHRGAAQMRRFLHAMVPGPADRLRLATADDPGAASDPRVIA